MFHVTDLFQYVQSTREFKIWQLRKNQDLPTDKYAYYFLSDLGVNLTSKCNLNCSHCCFKEYLNSDKIFDYEKFYNFLNTYLRDFKGDKLMLHLNCGEITMIDVSELFSFLYNCVDIFKNHNIRLGIRINSNLMKVSKDHLYFFKICKEVCEYFNQPFIFITSTDYYHINSNNLNRHIANIQKLQNIGISVNCNTLLTTHKELQKLKTLYKDLNTKFILQIEKDFENLDNDCNKLTLSEQFKTYLKDNKIDVSLHVFGCSKYRLKSIYTYNNTLVQCPFFAPFQSDWKVEPTKISNIKDIYEKPIFQVQRYLMDYTNMYSYSMCPILFYYNKHRDNIKSTTGDINANCSRS